MRSIVFCWYFRRCAPIISSFVDRAIATPTSSLSRCCQLPAAAHQKELSIARSVGPAQSCQHNRRGAQWQPSLQPHFTAPWLSTARQTHNDRQWLKWYHLLSERDFATMMGRQRHRCCHDASCAEPHHQDALEDWYDWLYDKLYSRTIAPARW